jgi:hypothetical protein
MGYCHYGWHSVRDILDSYKYYYLRSILLFANIDVSNIKMCLDTFILAKSNMGRREYEIYVVICS